MNDPHELVADGRFLEAMRAFEARAADTGDADDLIDAASAAIDGEAYSDAERLARQAIDLDPERAAAYVQLGLLYQKLERWEDAKPMFETALQYEVRQSLLTLLGKTQWRLGEAAQAEATLRQAIEMDPEWDDAYHMLGVVLQNSSPEEAIHHFRRALEIDPGRGYTQRELAVALWHADRIDDAIDACERAVETLGHDASSHHILGCLLLAKGSVDEARYELQRGSELEPSSGLVWAHLAAATTEGGGAPEQVREIYECGLSHAPSHAVLCREYGVWLSRNGDTSAALEYLRRALALAPTDRKAREALTSVENSAQAGEGPQSDS